MQKYALERDYVQVPNETAQAPEEDMSLQALGLITNIWSYNVEKWELHKTELYKRYVKNKKTSVMSAWDELVELKYIIEFKFRKGKTWEYVYIYRIKPFTEEEIEMIMADCVREYGVSSTSDFEKLKMNSSKCASQNTHISNISSTQDSINEIKIKEKNQKDNIYINSLLEEEGPPANEYKYQFSEIELKNAYSFIAPQFRETLMELDFDDDFRDRIIFFMYQKGIKYFSATEYRRKRVEIEKNGFKDKKGNTIQDLALYIVNGIKMTRESKGDDTRAYHVEKAKKLSKKQKQKEAEMKKKTESVPFYNWLEQQDQEYVYKPKKGINSSYNQTDPTKLDFKNYKDRPAFENLDDINFDIEDEDLPF